MPVDLPNPTEVAVPAFILLILIELFYGWRSGKTRFETYDTLTSLLMGTGSTIAGALTGAFAVSLAFWVHANVGLFEWGYAWWVFIIAFILDDLAYYWVHRMGHRMRWMWAAHVIHHSSQHYNLSTALRQTWTGRFTPGILFKLPIFALGIDPRIVFFCAGINLVYQFWIHTEAIDKLPRWFEYIFNTPSHHRVHHANNPRYLDANYAGVLMIWDRMFGSFIAEEKTEPPRYGLVSDLGTFNPLRVAFHEWVSIFKDIAAAKTWKARLFYLIAPPGWTPDGSRLTSDMIRERWLAREQSKARGELISPAETIPPAE